MPVPEHGALAAGGLCLERHRAFAGASGGFRAGPGLVVFESLCEQFARKVSGIGAANLFDRFVRD